MSPKVSAEYMRARRSEILEAATTVFSEKGFHAATLDEVAGEAGVSKGSIYNHFDSKESIIDALTRQWGTLDDETFSRAGRSGSAIAALREVSKMTIGRTHRRGFRDSVRLELFLWSEALVNPRVGRSQGELATEWRGRVQELVEAAQEAGEIDRRVDGETVAVFLGSLFMGLYMHGARGVGFKRAEMERILESFLSSLAKSGT